MPIYEYRCDKCEHEFEREQRISDAPVKTCPACRSRKVKKLISQTSFVLKGGGWYSDLYSSSRPGKDAGGDDAKPDSKSAAKKEGSSKESKGKESGKSDASPDSKSGSSGSKAAAA